MKADLTHAVALWNPLRTHGSETNHSLNLISRREMEPNKGQRPLCFNGIQSSGFSDIFIFNDVLKSKAENVSPSLP